jgi:hypothetical protein
LKDHTSIHVHADLIVGLPGESLETFAAGFDRLVRLAPHEIQVGMLKRLRGTPIVRHDDTWQMVYSPHPPYEILQTRLIDFSTVQELRRFAKYWDTIANSGNFVETIPLIWTHDQAPAHVPVQKSAADDSRASTPQVVAPDADRLREDPTSPFREFRRLSSWLFAREQHSHGVSMGRLVELLFEYLTKELAFDPHYVAHLMWRDYQRGGRSDKPSCLAPFLSQTCETPRSIHASSSLKRQGRRIGLVKEN